MSKGEAQLLKDRESRDRARTALETRFVQVKADLAAKGLGARAAESVLEETREAAEIGLEVARERKGVVAGTFGALLLWLLRKPIIDGAIAALDRLRGEDADDDGETQNEERDGEQGK